jgi:hypothetical protein
MLIVRIGHGFLSEPHKTASITTVFEKLKAPAGPGGTAGLWRHFRQPDRQCGFAYLCKTNET